MPRLRHAPGRVLRAPAALLLAVLACACGGGDGPPTGPPPKTGPATLAVAGGNDQTAPAGTELSQPLVVRVTDAAGKPLAGVAVAWQVTAGGGSLAPAGATDAAGEARARWMLGTAAGSNAATATVAGVSAALFSAAGAPGPVETVTLAPESAALEVGATRQLTAAARDRHGNAVSGRAFQWSSTRGDVAAVDAGGVVTALAPGTSLVVATLDAKSDTTTVTVLAPPVLPFAALTAGWTHTCGVTAAGAAYCWGNNTGGQLGRGPTGETCGASGSCSTAPVAAMAGTSFGALRAGPLGTCGIATGGRLSCWGEVALVATGVRSAAVGRSFVCYAADDGRATCVGDNLYGQLGRGTSGSGTGGVVEGGHSFRQVVAGERHACALTAAGAAFCWGANDRGQLGSQPAGELCNGLACSTRPAAVAGDLGFTTLSAGMHHTCGLTAAGTAHCWGSNATGQLGNGGSTDARAPAAVSGGLAFRSIDAAGITADAGHTCAVTTGGAAYCWGANARGELGTTAELAICSTNSGAAYLCARTPLPVAGGIAFTSVAAGQTHSCGAAERGVAYCWGENNLGQLGDGTRTNRPTPVRVADPR